MPTLQLYFLGTLDIRYDDQELPRPPTLKSQSLLAYLVLHRSRPQPRERLAGLFWGDRPERKARRSLATALWHIRRGLPDEGLILSDPHTVQFEVLAIAPLVPPGRSPLDAVAPSKLVGREQEMAFLSDCWQEAEAGQSGLALISGEAGVGKTRLVEEFANRLRWQGVRVLWGRCYEFERLLPYQPIAEALRTVLPALAAAELADFPTWTVAEVARLVPEMLEKLVLSSVEGRPGLEVTPSIRSDQERARFFDGVARFLAGLSSHRTALIVLEDLHWATESTLQLVHYLTRRLADHQVLMVGTFRQEAVGPQHPLWALQQQLIREGLAKSLHLPRLSSEAVEALVVETSGAGEAVVPLARRLYQETEGNPFFVMEIIKALFGTGMVHLEGGTWQGDFVRLSEEELPLPAGVSEAIQDRVRRLNEDAREAVRLAAVLGREFDFDLLNAVWGRGEEATLEALDDLLRRRLIGEGTGAMGRDYAFTHHKVQEVVYAAMSRRRQQHLHAQVGEVMESLYGPQAEALAGELAFHFQQGRQLDQALTEKAVHYLRHAGDQAVRLAANQEAIAHFARGLELLETLTDTPERARQELALQLALGASLMATKGYGAPEVGCAYHRALELCQQMGETPQLFWTLQSLVAFYGIRAQLQTAIEVAEQNLRIAERTQDPVNTMFARWALGAQLLFVGEFAQALDYMKQVIDFYDPEKHRSLVFKWGMDAGTYCPNWAAHALWFLGYPDQALKRSQEALARAQELNHPFNLAFALCLPGICFNALCREFSAARDHVEPLIQLSVEEGFPLFQAWGTFLRGWFLTEEEQAEEGMAQMRQGLAASQATGTELQLTQLLAMLAEAHLKMGQVEEGLKVLSEALAQVEKSRERWWEAEIYRLKGELLLMQAKAKAEEEAEACFHQAIEVARQQQAKSWELRATVSLCRLWQKPGKDEEARQILAEIYGWFTEGFDMPDLKEAKALLKALS